MKAALIRKLGDGPIIGERDAPTATTGNAVITVGAAALNPADLAIAGGLFPAGAPPVPYVPGIEAVGRVQGSARFADGTRVYASGAGLGVSGDGTFADQFAVAESVLVEVPEGVTDEQAAAFGQAGLAAWLPLTWLTPVREGESVLVLGATGSVGTVAVQAASLLGASRVVGVGRNPERLERRREEGADAVVACDSQGWEDELRRVCEQDPPTLVFDCLWGEPLEAALAVCARGARIVHVGQAAGSHARLASGFVRGKQLQLFGYSNFAVPAADLARGYRELLGRVAEGQIRLDISGTQLDDLPDGWARLAGGDRTKLVVRP